MAARSSGSLVKTTSSRTSAPTTTDASTTSDRFDRAHAAPVSRLAASVNASKRHPERRRDSSACGPPRQACASTPAGTVGRSPRSSARLWNAQSARLPFSAASNAPASYVIPAIVTPSGRHVWLDSSADRRKGACRATRRHLEALRPSGRRAHAPRRPPLDGHDRARARAPQHATTTRKDSRRPSARLARPMPRCARRGRPRVSVRTCPCGSTTVLPQQGAQGQCTARMPRSPADPARPTLGMMRAAIEGTAVNTCAISRP